VLCSEAEPRWFRAQLEPVRSGAYRSPAGRLLRWAPDGPAVGVAPEPGIRSSKLPAAEGAGATGRCLRVQATAAWLPGRGQDWTPVVGALG